MTIDCIIQPLRLYISTQWQLFYYVCLVKYSLQLPSYSIKCFCFKAIFLNLPSNNVFTKYSTCLMGTFSSQNPQRSALLSGDGMCYYHRCSIFSHKEFLLSAIGHIVSTVIGLQYKKIRHGINEEYVFYKSLLIYFINYSS